MNKDLFLIWGELLYQNPLEIGNAGNIAQKNHWKIHNFLWIDSTSEFLHHFPDSTDSGLQKAIILPVKSPLSDEWRLFLPENLRNETESSTLALVHKMREICKEILVLDLETTAESLLMRKFRIPGVTVLWKYTTWNDYIQVLRGFILAN